MLRALLLVACVLVAVPVDAARPLPLHAARTSTARRAARALRQYTDSVGATAVDKSQYNPAVTLHAQALTSSQLSIAHNEMYSTTLAQSAQWPTGVARGAASNAGASEQQSAMGGLQLAANTYRHGAIATTQYEAVAASFVDSQMQGAPAGTPGTARGVTYPVFEPIDRKSQRGSHTAGTQLVQTASIGTQFHPAKAWSQVDIGDGANAISIANEATASAYSSQDHDGLDPTRPQPLMRRPLKEDGSFQTALPQPVKLD